jgi:hypothetical protein
MASYCTEYEETWNFTKASRAKIIRCLAAHNSSVFHYFCVFSYLLPIEDRGKN